MDASMTKYNFHRLRVGESAFYPVQESGEKVFRSAVANWVKRQRETGNPIVIQCRRVVKTDIMQNPVFIGMEITREV
jgi:hypothetical protein